MFIGHFGVGFAGKRFAPSLSLGTLFLAAQFLDLLWPTLILLGVEKVRIVPGITRLTPLDFYHYPISHSLAAAVCWSVLIALLVLWAKRKVAPAVVAGVLVTSHWFLDLLVHRPDLPLIWGSPLRFGFGLWNSVAGTLIVELSIFAVGLAVYVAATTPRDRIGSWSLWALVGFLLAVYLVNLFGPPPPSVKAIGWAGEAMWLLVVWGYWIDRHRRPRAGSRQSVAA